MESDAIDLSRCLQLVTHSDLHRYSNLLQSSEKGWAGFEVSDTCSGRQHDQNEAALKHRYITPRTQGIQVLTCCCACSASS